MFNCCQFINRYKKNLSEIKHIILFIEYKSYLSSIYDGLLRASRQKKTHAICQCSSLIKPGAWQLSPADSWRYSCQLSAMYQCQQSSRAIIAVLSTVKVISQDHRPQTINHRATCFISFSQTILLH